MDRRRFLLTSLAGALTAPLAAEAQTKVPTIGVLSPWGASLAARGQREPFERGLRDLGWTPGSNILIEQRYAEGKSERLPSLAAELIQMKMDVIVAHGDAAIRAARQFRKLLGDGRLILEPDAEARTYTVRGRASYGRILEGIIRVAGMVPPG